MKIKLILSSVILLLVVFSVVSIKSDYSSNTTPPKLSLGRIKSCNQTGYLAGRFNDFRMAWLAQNSYVSTPDNLSYAHQPENKIINENANKQGNKIITEIQLARIVKDKLDYRLFSEFQYKFALNIAHSVQTLTSDALEGYALQACVIAFQSFKKPEHYQYLRDQAHKCQHEKTTGAVKQCMRFAYGDFLKKYQNDLSIEKQSYTATQLDVTTRL